VIGCEGKGTSRNLGRLPPGSGVTKTRLGGDAGNEGSSDSEKKSSYKEPGIIRVRYLNQEVESGGDLHRQTKNITVLMGEREKRGPGCGVVSNRSLARDGPKARRRTTAGQIGKVTRNRKRRPFNQVKRRAFGESAREGSTSHIIPNRTRRYGTRR